MNRLALALAETVAATPTSSLNSRRRRRPVAMPDETLPIRLVLNTWVVLRLHAASSSDRTLGGLPNDFLTHGAAALLLFDHVVCDTDGLATEAGMKNWVSTHIFSELTRHELLRPVAFRELYSPKVNAKLDSTGLLDAARSTMHQQRSRIERGDIATDALQIPPLLRWLNSVMFMGIDLPNTLHYDYHDNHFANLSLSALDVIAELGPHTDEIQRARKEANKTATLAEMLRLTLPDFRLLPPIIDPKARAALQENLRAEKRMMYRYVYGGMKHEEYERFRSGIAFSDRDALVDSSERKAEADRNLEVLFAVRDKTKNVRPRAQGVIKAVIAGERSLESVRTELRTIRSEVDEALRQESRVRELQVLSGTYALLGAAEVIHALQLQQPLAALPAFLPLAEAARGLKEAEELESRLSVLGRRHPLAWVAGKYRQEQARQRT